MLNKYSGFIFDLDGTVYRGSTTIPGADKVINRLNELGKEIIYVTNKTTGTIEEYASFLRENGIQIDESQIISCTEVIREYLINKFPGRLFYAIGESTFINAIDNHIVQYSEDPENIDIVVITLDRTLNFDKLEIAARALERGAKFFAANIDDTCPVNNGEITDAGTVISALEKRTGRVLEDHFGKPSEHMFKAIKRKISLPLENYLLVGDRIQTDIQMGNKFGIDTALVSTGVKNKIDSIRQIRPKYELSSINEILTFTL